MPKRNDIHKVMIIGSGPIVIGQGNEYDYSGTQACKALHELGYKIVLVNSDPATIMTDPGMADATYIEPLNAAVLESIIAKERPDAILPNLGGQSGLNLTSELHRKGVLDKYGVKVIGVNIAAIERSEDRRAFKETMTRLRIEMPMSELAYSVEEAEKIASGLGYPVVIKPAYTVGGAGGGLVYNVEELRIVARRGISESLIGQVLVEESVLGWEELEIEVLRDAKNNIITVCFIENVDPMGVHTGDSLCTMPMLTIDTDLQRRLRKYAYDIVEAAEVTGNTNIQFAHNPLNGRLVVIEINPRTSRSSALASKAVGLPIAFVSTKLAAGLTMDEIPCRQCGTLDKYEPFGEDVVVKFSRWAFEKFKGSQDRLGTRMRAVGEVMSIGKTYKEALQKSVRSLEIGRYGLGHAKDFHEKDLETLLEMLSEPSSERQFIMYEALRKGATIEDLEQKTHLKAWFIGQMKELVDLEEKILAYSGKTLPDEVFIQAKKDGFADRYLAGLLGLTEDAIRDRRIKLGLVHGYQKVSVSGVENAEYYYSTYNAPDVVAVSDRPKIMVLGGGPNRIGQGGSFDYCCVHAAFTIKDMGYESIMVNCNPLAVSTDYDTSDKLYFEPLTGEEVLGIYHKEKPQGVICQFGGRTPLNIAHELMKAGVKILGTTPQAIDLAEDRGRFGKMMAKLGIPMPESGTASTLDEAKAVADRIGYPLMVRPSHVLDGSGMEVMYDEDMLREYMRAVVDPTPGLPILIDKFLDNAIGAEADALSDGYDAFVPAVLEHIERSGVHSGDSACVIPPISISPRHLDTIIEFTKRIAVELGVKGLMNMKCAIHKDTVYVLEANPRASRTVPLVSKVCNIPMADIATRIILGKRLADFDLKPKNIPYFGVKEAVFPFNVFPEVDPLLGPEMRSTGEVLGMAETFGLAFYKASEAASQYLPMDGCVLLTVSRRERPAVLEVARLFNELGFKIKTTRHTHAFLAENGIASEMVLKLHEGRPNIIDGVKNKEYALIINTPSGKLSKHDDSYIRKAAISYKVPYITTLSAAVAAAKGIAASRKGKGTIKSLQEYHRDIG